jgi:translation initiation factor IF-2
MDESVVLEELRLQQKEKVRLYTLARELDIDTKILLQFCKELGFDVKNQLSSLDPEQCDQLKARATKGNRAPAASTPTPRPAIPAAGVLSNKVRNLNVAKRDRESESPGSLATENVPTDTSFPPVPTMEPGTLPASEPAPRHPVAHENKLEITATQDGKPTAPPETTHTVAKTKEMPPAPPASTPAEPTPLENPPTPAPSRPPAPAERSPMRDLSANRVRPPSPLPPSSHGTRPPSGGASPPGKPPESGGGPRRVLRPLRPGAHGTKAGGAVVPPSLRQQVRQHEVKRESVLKPDQKLSVAEMEKAKSATTKSQMERILKQETSAPQDLDEDEAEKNRRGSTAAPGGAEGIPGRKERHEKRKERAEKRKASMAVSMVDGRIEVEEDLRPSRLRSRSHAKIKVRKPITEDRKGAVPIQAPITVRALSGAIGWPVGKLIFQLMELGAPKSTNVNSIVDIEMAETIALEASVELDIRKPADVEERLMAGLGQDDDPAQLAPRAPVVTIMGHVDHGKTTLLDKIRSTEIAKGEVGGITQVIRAWRLEHQGRPITFLDTPGHEAFTKMRARGAQVTDIAVIVVAADDGVMPQTEEAINHAKAAGVQIVVAINKVDMPNANVQRTRQQLYSLNLLPDDMGGDTPFVETSAVTGQGIDALLEQLSIAAELRELKANPHKAAQGTCLEAHLEGDEGVFATMLVQQGTLHKGDVVLCGATYGRVRAMYDDQNRPIEEAGPTVPVRITGLDEAPEAGDTFHVVPELSSAREVAEKRNAKRHEAAQNKHQPLTLEALGQKKATEVKVILKADFRGSIEAIRKELGKLQHDEVKVRLLHTGIGAITESDVQLALASPDDTIIVGFNAVPDNQALAMAEQRGISIREYNIIYRVTEDIKAALEGKLKPREEIIHLGRAVVRKTFKISKVGTVAGCFVTQGTIERSAKVRVIREGVVIYPPPDRTASLESLKRVKDDAREVAQGYDCGLKIAGYDDIKEGDVIEAYRIEQVQRTL